MKSPETPLINRVREFLCWWAHTRAGQWHIPTHGRGSFAWDLPRHHPLPALCVCLCLAWHSSWWTRRCKHGALPSPMGFSRQLSILRRLWEPMTWKLNGGNMWALWIPDAFKGVWRSCGIGGMGSGTMLDKGKVDRCWLAGTGWTWRLISRDRVLAYISCQKLGNRRC